MEDHQQVTTSRVVRVDSVESWDSLITQAKNQGSPVFVHFAASWCVPSLAMNSHIEELAMDHHNILFLSVDVDDVKGVASKMEVKAMPTFVVMRNGEVVDRLVGANPDEIKKRVQGLDHSTTGNAE